MGTNILYLEVQTGIAVLLILLVRSGMRKLPGVYSYVLWLLVFARMLVPVSFESRFGLMPSTVESQAWMKEVLGQADGMAGESADGIPENGMRMDAGSGSAAGGKSGEAEGEDFHTGNRHADEGAAGSGLMTNGDTNGTGAALTDSSAGMAPLTESLTGADFVEKEDAEAEVMRFRFDDFHRGFQLSVVQIVLLILWAAGTVLILIYNGMALVLVKRRIGKAEHLKNNIYVCRQIESPFTLGMIRPKIYLPPGLSEEEQEYIICHESVHIRRKDHLAKSVAFLLAALHWFNPMVWTAFYYMGKDMEMSCDEKVIDQMGEKIKKEYSQSLLNFAKGKYPAAMTPITFGENSVKQRVSNVLAYRAAPKWTAVLGTLIIFVSAAALFTVRSDAEERGEFQRGEQQSGAQQVFGKGVSPAIKNVCASPELIDTDPESAQGSPGSALEYWARAFCDRNGDALFNLAADKENFQQWEMVEQRDGHFAFGESGPWAWEYDYEMDMSPDGSAAEITFHMRTSVPEIYLLKEKVRITELEGLYYVDHESAWNNYSIDTGQEYEEAYGGEVIYDESGIYGGSGVYGDMAELYDDVFYRDILAHLQAGGNTGFYHQFLSPVTAAKELLHLGEGTGKLTEWQMVPAAALRSEEAVRSDGDSMDLPGWTGAMSVAGEGSRVVVSYTFAKDGSCVEIPMELKEGSQGIWGLTGGGIREIYSWVSEPEMTEHEEGKADLNYVIELSNYGIYRLGAYSGLTCLWAGDAGPEAAVLVSEGTLYILESPERAKENSDDGTEVLFALDLFTGELHREHLAIPRNYESVFPNVNFGIRDGYVSIYGYGRTYRIPLENQNEILWNNKTFRQMSEEDKQNYGAANRDYLLSNPDTLVRWSVREAERTSVFIDLDGDGVSEQVILSTDQDQGTYQLQAGGSVITGWCYSLHNDIWAYSPDGERIILALYENGPSADPMTCLFGYENGDLTALGEFCDDIRTCTIENGTISGTERNDVLQTDAIYASWRIGDSGKLELVPQKFYDFVRLNDIELLEELPVQNRLPLDEEGLSAGMDYYTISPQTIRFLRTDSTFNWIYVEAEDGSRGWFQMDGYKVKELDKSKYEVFGNLFLVD